MKPWRRDIEELKTDLKHCHWEDWSPLKWKLLTRDIEKTIRRAGGVDYKVFPPDFRWHLCSSRMSQGKFHNYDGWEFRSDWSITFQGYNGGPKKPIKKWCGGQVENLVIACEQGVGDEILYSSAIPELMVRLGRKPLELQCHPRLFEVFKRSYGLRVTPRRVLSEIEGDVVALADLFMFYRRDKSHFPKKPYLKPDPVKREEYLEKLKDYPKPWIGVGWKSRHGRLDVGVMLQKLERLGGTRFSVQYGEKDERLVDIQPDPLEDLDSHMAFVSCLDRVVSCTQTVLHESGSMGVYSEGIKPPKGSGDVKGQLWYYSVGPSPQPHLVYGNFLVWENLESYEPR